MSIKLYCPILGIAAAEFTSLLTLVSGRLFSAYALFKQMVVVNLGVIACVEFHAQAVPHLPTYLADNCSILINISTIPSVNKRIFLF